MSSDLRYVTRKLKTQSLQEEEGEKKEDEEEKQDEEESEGEKSRRRPIVVQVRIAS